MSIGQLTKLCSRCQETLPVAEFHKNRTKKDGLHSQCKICRKRYSLSAVARAYQKRYDYSAARKAARRRYNSSELGRATHCRNNEKHKKRHPDREKARNAIQKLFVAGKLPRAKTLKCIDCGAQAKEYHHYLGYSEEHRLDVIPLCKQCHTAAGIWGFSRKPK